jgi:hypothetical protein
MTAALCNDATCLAACSTSTDKLHERVCAPFRIVEMDLWDAEAIDLPGPGYIQFDADRTGHFRFIAVEGWMDTRAAGATGARTWNSPGKATTRAIPPAAVAGRCWRRAGR